jgi:hypothetical protein
MIRIFTRLLLLTVVLSLFTLPSLAQQNVLPTEDGGKATGGYCWIYNIKITGKANGNSFTRYGRFGLVWPGITNSYEMWIVSGEPGHTPAKGAVIFTTNSFYANSSIYSASEIDLATVTLESGGVMAKPILAASQTYGVNKYTMSAAFSSFRRADTGHFFADWGDNKVWGDFFFKQQGKTGAIKATFKGSLVSSGHGHAFCKFNNR